MATLTLESYQGHLNLQEGTLAWRLHRFYGGNPKEYSVFITNGHATPFPGRAGYTMADVEAADLGSGYGGKAAFIGGYVWNNLTAGEQTILCAAGYNAECGGGEPPGGGC